MRISDWSSDVCSSDLPSRRTCSRRRCVSNCAATTDRSRSSMKRNFKTLLISGLCALAAVPVLASNPIVKGWYADPEIRIFDGQYWIYPTYSDHYGTLDTSPEFTDAQTEDRKSTRLNSSH